MAWKDALNKLGLFLYEHERRAIEANLTTSSQTMTEDALARAGDDHLEQAKVFVPFIRAPPNSQADYNQQTVELHRDLGLKGAEDSIFEGGYSRRPDSFFKIGDTWVAMELRTKGDDHKIAEARGEVVILGNLLWKQRTKTKPFYSFQNEVFGLVGNGIDVQCVRQIHAYGARVKAYNGPLLPLAGGDFKPGDSYTVDLESPALMWVAGALHRIVVTNASKISPCSEMNKDGYYGCVKLTTRAGYWEILVTVVGATRNNKISVVMKVFWEGEVWWLKVGPDAEAHGERHDIQGMLGDGGGTAFPVTIEGANRPAMLVKDAGDSVSKQLLSREFAPADVYEMSKQLYEALEVQQRGAGPGKLALLLLPQDSGRQPWSSAADEFEVLQLRTASMRSLIEEHGRHPYPPLLCKLRGIVLGAH
ncbi:hypothetical protein SELMODRAFT_412015 [Selaginella moellendorffii]|uniref:Uncharacterized protein n=1 Tax=Selaginella moellendorffii TaxID=88036 RepID=D8RJS4_SELML|nr:hypothetical protein SELMODRAFT_412015 [Selaginella moellendorffii]